MTVIVHIILKILHFSFLLVHPPQIIVYYKKAPGGEEIKMKELNILKNTDIRKIRNHLSESCGLTIPDEKEHMGLISFHLFKYEHHLENNESGKDEMRFQIRWGAHKIYSKKHFFITDETNVIEQLKQFISQDCMKIKKELLDYCKTQLGNIVTLEVEPEINKRNPGLIGYQIQVDRGRTNTSVKENAGWPCLCIFISWFDELGDFQEFVYPVKFDGKSRQFLVDAKEIADAFQVYRDTVV